MIPEASTQKVPHPVGDSVQRVDAFEKVIGAAQFADDIQFGPGLLFARIKRSDRPHALIKKIDFSRALALPGVKAVVTGEDYSGMMGLYLTDRHIFCRDRVRYVGDPVAGVAAINEEIAEKAVDLIEVDYEDLPGIFDPELGAQPGAELIHPDLGKLRGSKLYLPGAGDEHLQPLSHPQG